MTPLTEAVLVALITGAVALGGAWWKFRSDLRKTTQEEMAVNTTARLELERLLMARIDQLHKDITALEARITAKDARIQELETRVDELEAENARLKAELARICGERKK